MPTDVLSYIDRHKGELEVIPNVTITPEIAQRLMERNTHNRPVKERVVRKYAQDMREGRWLFTGDTLRFTRDGKLADGQHRLRSIMVSGKPQTFNIQLGLDEEAFTVMDVGRNRSAGDTLALMGYTNTNVMASAVRTIMAYDDDRLAQSRKLDTNQRYDNQAIARWLENQGDTKLLQIMDITAKLYARNRHILTHSVMVAFYYLFSRSNEDKAFEFFHELISGENISMERHSSVYLLREKLLNWRGKQVSTPERYATIIKAWNFYVRDQEIRQLKWRTGEEFPVIR